MCSLAPRLTRCGDVVRTMAYIMMAKYLETEILAKFMKQSLYLTLDYNHYLESLNKITIVIHGSERMGVSEWYMYIVNFIFHVIDLLKNSFYSLYSIHVLVFLLDHSSTIQCYCCVHSSSPARQQRTL